MLQREMPEFRRHYLRKEWIHYDTTFESKFLLLHTLELFIESPEARARLSPFVQETLKPPLRFQDSPFKPGAPLESLQSSQSNQDPATLQGLNSPSASSSGFVASP